MNKKSEESVFIGGPSQTKNGPVSVGHKNKAIWEIQEFIEAFECFSGHVKPLREKKWTIQKKPLLI